MCGIFLRFLEIGFDSRLTHTPENGEENKTMKIRIRNKKLVFGVFAVLIAFTMVATAGLLTFYGKVETTANVKQSVVLWDGNNWQDYNTPISEDFDATGGCCKCFTHNIKNRGCVEAPIDMTTDISGPGGPGGVGVSYRIMEYEYENNEYNNDDDWYAQGGYYEPYITWVINENCIDFTFHNPTPHQFVFDYRVDMEPGEDHEWTDMTIGEGPCAGETFGQKYNWVNVAPGTTETVTVCPCHKVSVGLRIGAEQNWYIPWITFEMPELTSPFTLQPGEQLDFIIQYCFDIAIIPGAYDITTIFAPAE